MTRGVKGRATLYREPPRASFDLVREFEKSPNGDFAANTYVDRNGDPRIGWGHRIVSNFDPLRSRSINRAKADQLLADDLINIANCLCNLLPIASVGSLGNAQWAALIDFTFDITIARFKGSAVRKLIVAGDVDIVANEFSRWVHIRDRRGNKVLIPNLVDRRAAERALWLGATEKITEPSELRLRGSRRFALALPSAQTPSVPA